MWNNYEPEDGKYLIDENGEFYAPDKPEIYIYQNGRHVFMTCNP